MSSNLPNLLKNMTFKLQKGILTYGKNCNKSTFEVNSIILKLTVPGGASYTRTREIATSN
jgi:hypothetical protein